MASLVLVTGATGAVGPALVASLLQKGHRVRALSRSRMAVFLPDVEQFVGDVTDQTAVARAVQGVDRVFHLAALVHQASDDPRLNAAYEAVNVQGAEVVAAAAAAAGATRLVFFSSIAVYGPTGPGVADEDTSPRPDTPYARSKLRAEQALLGANGSPSRQPLVTVLRLGAVYGPHMKGNYRRLAEALRSRRFLPVGDGRNRRTLVHEADAAEAALLVAESPQAAGRIYNVTDGRVHQLCDIIDAICMAAGRRSPRLAVPLTLASMLAGAGDAVLRLGGRRGRLLPVLDKYREDVAVSGERIARELGYRPRFDLAGGWRDALASPGGP